MAGVAGPMLIESRSNGLRFLAGLVVGSLLTGTVLALALVVTGGALTSVLPFTARVILAGLLLLVLGILDLRNRTPHIWRQVPQRFVRELPPGQLGLIWGADLGTLFSTQKASSLIWGALGMCVLLDPGSAIVLATMVSLVATLVIGGISHMPHSRRAMSRPVQALLPKVRIGTGAVLAVSAVLVTASLF